MTSRSWTKLFCVVVLIVFTLSLLGPTVSQKALAASTLSAGDIAIIGFNFDDADQFAFVLLTDVEADTQIKFTDNGWQASNIFRTGEGITTWTASSAQAAGTVIVFTAPSSGDFSATTDPLFSTGGDQILAYQGPDSASTFLYALNSEGAGVWQADATSSNTSALPLGLINGTSAVALDEIDNAIYTGSTSGTKAEILAAISNKDNWSGSDYTRQTMPSGPFTISVSDVAPAVSSTTPTSDATGVAVDANISVTFSEAVDVTSSWYSISCASSGTHAAAVTGGPATFTLNPDSDFANGESCTVTLYAAQITDQDSNDPPDNMTADYSWSFTVVTSGAPAVLINEVDADTPSTDVAEFVELYDGGAGNTSLTGFVVVLFNGNGDVSYGAFDLDGRSTDSSGYFVICGDGTNVANCDWDVTPDQNLIQNGADAVALYQADATDFPNGTAVTTANLVDALVYDTSDADDAGLLVLLNTGEPQVNEDGQGNSANDSNQRCPNGSGGARNTSNYDQAAPTSGTDNVCGSGGSCSTISEIQGTGNTSSCLGHRDNIEGCITGVTATGFYFQDVIGDGDPASSDGIYAYYYSTWDNPSNLQPGDLVQVSGEVTEYYDTTEFANRSADPLSVTRLPGSCTVPAPVTISPVTDPTADPMVLYERYEGMRVQMTFDGWVVGATKRFDSRYAYDDPEIAFVDFGSSIPDYSRVFERDYTGYQGIQYLSGGLNFDLPDLDFGDGIAGTNVTGVLGYQFDKYTLLVDATPTLTTVDNPDVVPTNPVLDPTKAEVDACFFNVENLFDNINDSAGDWGDWAPGYPDSDTSEGLALYEAKLAAVADVIVDQLHNCMVIGVQEMEGKQAVYDALAAALHTADASHTWTGVYVESGDSRDISQGFLYRDDVILVGNITPVTGSPYTEWVSDGTLDFVRVPATALFRFNSGTPYELDVHLYSVHFKSKASSASCSTPDCTDRRELEAADLRGILEHHQTEGEYAIAGGDFNDTFGSTPIDMLDASTDITSFYYDLPATERWSYVFNGESEVLDHLYATNGLLYATSGWNHAFNPIHVNTDFPTAEQASDHDPLRLRLRLPSDYGSLSSYGQVWHLRIPGYTLQLGSTWTDDTVFDPTADDTDDGGVTFGTFTAGEQADLTVNVQGTPRVGRWLRVWFDWSADGIFDTDERVFNDSVSAGDNTLNFPVPEEVDQAVQYRVRLYDSNGIAPMAVDPDASGGANGGEVDDGTSPNPTAVTLASFDATSHDNAILVTWETASELDNVGFYLYRSTSATGRYVLLNATLIPSQNPGMVLGGYYAWLDTDTVPDVIYYYKLEDIDVRGVSTFHGPVTARVDSAPAATELHSLRALDRYGVWSGLVGLLVAVGLAILYPRRKRE